MPYKDPDKRAEYLRVYKAKGKPGNPLKCYVCFEYPGLQVKNNVWFKNGFIVTADPDIQARIEKHHGYGKIIFSWRVEPCPG